MGALLKDRSWCQCSLIPDFSNQMDSDDLQLGHCPPLYALYFSLFFLSILFISFAYKSFHLRRVMRKPDFAYAKTKPQISCASTAQLISTFVFATPLLLIAKISCL